VSLAYRAYCPAWILRAAGDQAMPSTAAPLIAQVTQESVDRRWLSLGLQDAAQVAAR
jgi:hypothetical protein